MSLGQTLIDSAAKVGYTRYRLSKLLHVSQAFLSHVAHGQSAMGPALAARLAALSGMDARHAALQAIIEAEQDAVTKAELRELFGVEPTPSQGASSKV